MGCLAWLVDYSVSFWHMDASYKQLDFLPVATGGDKVLLHFAQKSPGDYVPQENILQALGISAEVCSSKPPQVSRGLGERCLLPTPKDVKLPWGQWLAWVGTELQPLRFSVFSVASLGM